MVARDTLASFNHRMERVLRREGTEAYGLPVQHLRETQLSRGEKGMVVEGVLRSGP